MSEAFIKKNISLLKEFDQYFFRTSREMAKLPDNGATIVLTVKGDEQFNRASMEMARKASSSRAKFVEARKDGDRWTIRPLKKI